MQCIETWTFSCRLRGILGFFWKAPIQHPGAIILSQNRSEMGPVAAYVGLTWGHGGKVVCGTLTPQP